MKKLQILMESRLRREFNGDEFPWLCLTAVLWSPIVFLTLGLQRFVKGLK